MDFVGVGPYCDARASQMSYGALKRLEIARALAAKPKLLRFDEPAAGLNHTETAEIEALIRKVADSGITVVLVEHGVTFVMKPVGTRPLRGPRDRRHRLRRRDGQTTLSGPGPALLHDEQVKKAYLGMWCPSRKMGEMPWPTSTIRRTSLPNR